VNQDLPKVRHKGIKKLNLVFNELTNQFGDEISSSELLLAAQKLIKISETEYSDKISQEYQGSRQFYALDVATAMEKYPHKILEFEDRNFSEHDDMEISCGLIEEFNKINLNFKDCKWEF